jgi:hypothetical protein
MRLIREIRSRSGELHFRRWIILRTPWFEVYIHGIYKEDQDLYLHNHPWKIWTMILKGGYIEELHNNSGSNIERKRLFGHKSKADINDFHKIKKMIKSPTYSLAVVGKRVNDDWGYMVDGEFVDHKTFRKNKNRTL